MKELGEGTVEGQVRLYLPTTPTLPLPQPATASKYLYHRFSQHGMTTFNNNPPNLVLSPFYRYGNRLGTTKPFVQDHSGHVESMVLHQFDS